MNKSKSVSFTSISKNKSNLLFSSSGNTWLVFKSKESSDFVSYLREMKKSIKHCPYMGSPVKITIEKLEKELEEKDNQRKEFEALAIGVKQKIYELVSLNKKNDALALISQLQTIIPEDTELKELIFSLNKP